MFLLSGGNGAVTVAHLKVTAHTVTTAANALYQGLLQPQQINVALRQECERQIEHVKSTTAEDRRLMWVYYDRLDQGQDSKCIPAGLSQLHALRVRQIRRAARQHIRRIHPIRARHLVAT